MSKVVKNLQTAIQLCGLEDGMTISFHHNLRGGDTIAGEILHAISELGIRDLTIAPSSLLTGHDALIPYLENGTITRIQTSGVTPRIGALLQSGPLLKHPVEMRTHGSRSAAFAAGQIRVDVAFLAASHADPYGNCSALSGASAFGSMGYAMVDAAYADKVVVVTDDLSPEPIFPVSIHQSDVNFVVPVSRIGDSAGIATSSLQPSKNPLDKAIAELTAKMIIASGSLYDGCRMQTGAGKISLSVSAFLESYMERHQIAADFAMGGITRTLVRMMEKGLVRTLYDVQSFDLDSVRSLLQNDRHIEVSAQAYADPQVKGGAIVNQLDFTILGATEIDTSFNVNVVTDSNNRLIYGGVRSGAFFQPAVLDGVTSGMDVAHDMEIFGPVFPLMTFETDEEAIHLANDTRYGLVASVFTRDMRKAFHFMRQLQAGMVVINGNSFYRSILTPFGGTKMSGLGREGLSVTLDEVTQVKTMVFKNIF